MVDDRELRRACEIVARKDEQRLRRALFERYSARNRAARIAQRVWEKRMSARMGAAFVATLALKCFAEVRFPRCEADLLAVWKYDNERRQIAALQALAPELRIAPISLAPSPRFAIHTTGWADGWRVIESYAERGDFLVAARVAETVGYYLRMLAELAASPARAILVSSDANPYAVALTHAARKLGKRTCFVTHGHVAERPEPLDFDLSLLDGPAVQRVYERAGPIRGRVVFRGSEGEVRAMDTRRLLRKPKTLGVVLSILVDWQRVSAVLDRLRRELAPECIVLRLHPNRALRDPRWADALDLDGVRVSVAERSLGSDVRTCELVVAGNTSAHLTILKLGVPTVYVPELDGIGPDYYGFVRDRIVATAEPNLDLRAIAGFYDEPGWPARFARYDAGYPDRQAACDQAVADALRVLVRRAPGASA